MPSYVPRTPLTDNRIWHCMLTGYYGRSKQRYARRTEARATALADERRAVRERVKHELDALL